VIIWASHIRAARGRPRPADPRDSAELAVLLARGVSARIRRPLSATSQGVPRRMALSPKTEGRPCMLGPPSQATLVYARLARHLAGRAGKLDKTGPVFALASTRSFSLDRRDQFSASAIQRTPLAGSRFASCLHSSARELSSSLLIIVVPCLRVELSPPDYDRCRSWNHCPNGHCPKGHVRLIKCTARNKRDSANAYAVSCAGDESLSKSKGSNWCPAASVTCTCQPERSSTRALSTATAGLMRIVTTLCPSFDA